MHAMRGFKRGSVDSGMAQVGKRQSELGNIVKRHSTLEGKKTLTQEEHPSGAGRGERRREMRGLIAPLPGRRASRGPIDAGKFGSWGSTDSIDSKEGSKDRTDS